MTNSDGRALLISVRICTRDRRGLIAIMQDLLGSFEGMKPQVLGDALKRLEMLT